MRRKSNPFAEPIKFEVPRHIFDRFPFGKGDETAGAHLEAPRIARIGDQRQVQGITDLATLGLDLFLGFDTQYSARRRLCSAADFNARAPQSLQKLRSRGLFAEWQVQCLQPLAERSYRVEPHRRDAA